MPLIETERLLLRKVGAADREQLIAMLGNPRQMRWLFSGRAMTREEAVGFLDHEFHFGARDRGLGVLCLKDPERFIGFAGITPCTHLGVDDLEFGFAVGEEAQGHGYALEIGRAQIAYGFDELGADRLLALAHPRNAPSLTVIERLGLNFLREIWTRERGPRRVYMVERGAWASPAPQAGSRGEEEGIR